MQDTAFTGDCSGQRFQSKEKDRRKSYSESLCTFCGKTKVLTVQKGTEEKKKQDGALHFKNLFVHSSPLLRASILQLSLPFQEECNNTSKEIYLQLQNNRYSIVKIVSIKTFVAKPGLQLLVLPKPGATLSLPVGECVCCVQTWLRAQSSLGFIFLLYEHGDDFPVGWMAQQITHGPFKVGNVVWVQFEVSGKVILLVQAIHGQFYTTVCTL